jgi:hypothetical protein
VVIVDTTVWIDYLQGISNPETDWLDARKSTAGVWDSPTAFSAK